MQKLELFNRMFFEVKIDYSKRIQVQWKTESSLKSQEAKLSNKIKLQRFSRKIADKHDKEVFIYILNKGHLGVIYHEKA